MGAGPYSGWETFKKDVIPYYIGVSNLTRKFLISRQSVIAKSLNSEANLILIADGTYAYHQKSKNNLYQRKFFFATKLVCKNQSIGVGVTTPKSGD